MPRLCQVHVRKLNHMWVGMQWRHGSRLITLRCFRVPAPCRLQGRHGTLALGLQKNQPMPTNSYPVSVESQLDNTESGDIHCSGASLVQSAKPRQNKGWKQHPRENMPLPYTNVRHACLRQVQLARSQPVTKLVWGSFASRYP